MIVFILLLLLLPAAFLIPWIAASHYPKSWLGKRCRLMIERIALFFLGHFLCAFGMLTKDQLKSKKPGHSHEKLKFRLMLSGLLLMVVLGLGAMFYPMLSSLYMDSVRSQIQSQYQGDISSSNQKILEQLKEQAQTYNRKLFSGELSLLTPEENGYFEQLLIPGGSQIMAYIHIPRIQVNLPILHGVSTEVLDAGCGHMPQSSLPVGGESTHAVISAHTGMASSPMFSDLPLLKPGDTFTIEALGEILTYQIQSEDDIRTVLPVEVQAVKIKNGQDLCTLVTCVPFGVNTHRLLVTGHRIPTAVEADTPEIAEAPDNTSLWKTEYLKSLWIGVGVLGFIAAAGACVLVYIRFRKKGNYEH